MLLTWLQLSFDVLPLAVVLLGALDQDLTGLACATFLQSALAPVLLGLMVMLLRFLPPL